MKRRAVLAGMAALGTTGALWWARPADRGAPHDDYFSGLQNLLRTQATGQPVLLIDLDRLDHNITTLRAGLSPRHAFRLVEKSLPSPGLIDYVLSGMGSRRIMSFHQPFLSQSARRFPDADILLGKPMPVAGAARFYDDHHGAFDPSRQLQWLVDSEPRLEEYQSLARSRALQLNINIEIDVGLHRGGVRTPEELRGLLDRIAAHPDRLRFSGFMGYDPHVVKVPSVLASRDRLWRKATAVYASMAETARTHPGELWREGLTLNGGGSPTYPLYHDDQLRNDLAIGSALVKPADFDLDTLEAHAPAAYIAAPVLKVSDGTVLPGAEALDPVFRAWDPNTARTHFTYGGFWKARPESPPGLQLNGLFGRSSNQEFLNGSAATGLSPGDWVFLRPTQSEAVLLEFGDLLAIRGGAVVDRWPVLTG